MRVKLCYAILIKAPKPQHFAETAVLGQKHFAETANHYIFCQISMSYGSGIQTKTIQQNAWKNERKGSAAMLIKGTRQGRRAAPPRPDCAQCPLPSHIHNLAPAAGL